MTSTIKVNTITTESGSTLTVGESGKTVALASGASQTGFGREGSVNWQTSIKTATFTATSGEGYFCNTTGGAFTINLPSSSSVGDIVAIKDYGSTFDTQNLTIGRGGSNLNGNAGDFVASTENLSLTLVYADATKGWLSVEEGTGYIGENFIIATGGTVTCSGNDKIHTFTGPGTFCVSSLASCAANNLVSYMVIAGGASGGSDAGGGGGAGGFRETKSPATPYTASPLDGYPTPGNRITVTATSFPITVGAGGAATAAACGPSADRGNPGSNSTFSTITSTGGGGGGAFSPSDALNGGSGGGGRASGAHGTGNTPPVTPAQGTPGAPTSNPGYSGGGGGATATGTRGVPSNSGGAGGAGATTSITGSPVGRAGGGAGGTGACWPTPGSASDGGGPGGAGPAGGAPGSDATANTGGGGGGGSDNSGGGAGGSGIVVIRYKYQ